MQPVADLTMFEQDLADIHNILRDRRLRDDENNMDFRGSEKISNDQIMKALQPQKFEDIRTNAKECPICYQIFGKEQQLDKLKSPVC